MSQTITVPDIGQYPIKINLNCREYTLWPGTEATVPDGVAKLLDQIVASEPKPAADGWKNAWATIKDAEQYGGGGDDEGGGGSSETYETVTEIPVGEMQEMEGAYFAETEAPFQTFSESEVYYLNTSDSPNDGFAIDTEDNTVIGILWNCKMDLDSDLPVPLDPSKPYTAVLKNDDTLAIVADTPDLSNTTVKILKKVSDGGDLPENVKATYVFDFAASISGDQITFTPAEGVTYAAIAAAIAKTPHVKAILTFPEAMGLTITADFNFSISGDDGVAYSASAICIIGSDPVAFRLSVGEDEGQTVCTGSMKTLAVKSA